MFDEIDEIDDMEESLDLQKHLETQFGKLMPATDSAPEDLKKEVFKTLDTFRLAADMADLFTVKFSQTHTKIIGEIDDASLEEKEVKKEKDNK